jgi:hypothetical protein
MYAKQHEPDFIHFDDVPPPSSGMIQLWMINNHERIAIASIVPDKAIIWWKEAESKDISTWEQLDPDPPWMKKFSQKVGTGLMRLVAKRPELKARVDNIRTNLYKEGKILSGRALYWILLNELRTSKNTHGLMNILDLQQVKCRGKEVRHLRGFFTYWQKCLQNFNVKPGEDVLQPLFEEQVRVCTSFDHNFTLYEVGMMRGTLDRSYQTLYDMVIRFLDIEQVKENDILAKGGTVNGKDPQWCMALYEQEVVKFRPGDCKAWFNKGKCNRSNCPYKHENILPAWARAPGKGKGKGKKGKGKKGKGKTGKGKGKKGKGKGKGK